MNVAVRRPCLISATPWDVLRCLPRHSAFQDWFPPYCQAWCKSTSAALMQLRVVIEGLTVNTERMRSNMDMTHGLVMAEAVSLALSPHLGRASAHALVEDACALAMKTDKSLFDILQHDERVYSLITRDDLQKILDPVNYLGQAMAFVDRVLTQHRQRKH
jgi:3-carboxy-cis,cis-muconate cycloisomerase